MQILSSRQWRDKGKNGDHCRNDMNKFKNRPCKFVSRLGPFVLQLILGSFNLLECVLNVIASLYLWKCENRQISKLDLWDEGLWKIKVNLSLVRCQTLCVFAELLIYFRTFLFFGADEGLSCKLAKCIFVCFSCFGGCCCLSCRVFSQ